LSFVFRAFIARLSRTPCQDTTLNLATTIQETSVTFQGSGTPSSELGEQGPGCKAAIVGIAGADRISSPLWTTRVAHLRSLVSVPFEPQRPAATSGNACISSKSMQNISELCKFSLHTQTRHQSPSCPWQRASIRIRTNHLWRYMPISSRTIRNTTIICRYDEPLC
jgi:hypothetical protein